ncbi:isoprenyl transferase [Synoicihabitans lomoniglobus]|uniref:Isoprenyl transferase n=1 Tax=Synoicihabitans lomoniglobus TaxID=2909285 RepID=A0AAE9ZUX0_9BACT|nr:isoprenyl transferase [Opitutaceae bacterium LMO-M01]WED63534.1 isoprenyl transferase [Opitutaceae bacterium LMO-M01]
MAEPESASVPHHVAIIMDGNGRWAKQRGLPRIEGHRRGVETVRRTIETARELGIEYLTLYAFSVENWRRPQDEVGALMGLLEYFLKRETSTLVKNQVRLRTIGRTDLLPDFVRQELERTIAATADFTEHTLVLALNYGSRTEVLDAAKSYAAAVAAGEIAADDDSWESFARHLYTKDLPDPDLVIRTSGETRVSNFLLMQAAYAEFVFLPIFWPDFSADHFKAAVAEFAKRERRFGRTGDQLRSPAATAAIPPLVAGR